MREKTKCLFFRGAAFMFLAGALFLSLQPKLYVERTRFGANIVLSEIGISIAGDATHTTVMVDDRHQRISTAELERSPLYQEAMQRIAERATSEIGESYLSLSPRRFIRFYLLPTALLYLVMFHLWPTREPGVEEQIE